MAQRPEHEHRRSVSSQHLTVNKCVDAQTVSVFICKSEKERKPTESSRTDFDCEYVSFSPISPDSQQFSSTRTYLSVCVCALLSRLFKFSSVRGGEDGNIRCQLLLFAVFLHIIIHRLFNLPSLNENPCQPLSRLPVGERKKLVWVVGALLLLHLFQWKKKREKTLNWTLENKGAEMIVSCSYGVFKTSSCCFYTKSLGSSITPQWHVKSSMIPY